ncbi:velvet factor-domain-containing protein [Trametes gibbosa]|nr:velvet factor-domain-containing protein [Trametes gibbosa]
MSSIQLGLRSATSSINRPVQFATGLFAGRTVRLELQEIQSAASGLKFTGNGAIDIPLDPPPVILCRFFTAAKDDAGLMYEEETDPAYAALGAICHVDMFPDLVQTGNGAPYYNANDCAVGHQGAINTTQSLLQPSNLEVAAWLGSTPIFESSKCTTMLFGTTTTSAAIVDYEGVQALVFVFSNLTAIRSGRFYLRFRVVSLLSTMETSSQCPTLAECFGSSFVVHTAETFPGRRSPTILTKHLAQQGVSVNIYDEGNGEQHEQADRPVSPEEVLLRFFGTPILAAGGSRRGASPSQAVATASTPWTNSRVVAGVQAGSQECEDAVGQSSSDSSASRDSDSGGEGDDD